MELDILFKEVEKVFDKILKLKFLIVSINEIVFGKASVFVFGEASERNKL
jgi:hypothetical protein